jgi:N-acyl-phosphatidylethanolamine-hydrolysing phospholipase D
MPRSRMTPPLTTTQTHRRPGGFVNPWPGVELHGLGGLLRWTVVERLTAPRRPDPPPASFARATPSFHAPRAPRGTLTATWVGHSTFLLQVGGLNVLTDPVWSERASPVPFVGPRRRTAPGIDFDALPPIDLVLQSHDHYDHLDAATVRRLSRRHPGAHWLAPLGVGDWLRRRGAAVVDECDWWDAVAVEPLGGGPPTGTLPPPPAGTAPDPRTAKRSAAALRVTCVPAQHFSGRSALGRNATLWCGWTVSTGDGGIFFAGDTGRHPEFARIASSCGPFDLALLPIGAYEPRWFMGGVHCNPEDAVSAYQDLVRDGNGGRPCLFAGGHWGTFKLTDEPMDEPPARTRQAWQAAGIPDELLWIPSHGETRTVAERSPAHR